MTTDSKRVMERIFEKETPFKKMAEKAARNLYIPATCPGGTRIFAPKMQGTIWGKPHQITMSLLKTDVYDRRYVAHKPCTVDEVVKGAFSEANRDFDDPLPHMELVRARNGILDERGGRRNDQQWSNSYPFPCIKPVGQIIIRAEDLKGGKRPEGSQSLKNGMIKVNTSAQNGSSIDLDYLIGMKRNIVAVNVAYHNLEQKLMFRLYRNQDQGHRRYMDEAGNYKPEKERFVVFTPADPTKPLQYYDLEADADINGPFEPPKSGIDGRFFWISQRFPAEATFPEGFEYVMMGLVSDRKAIVHENKLQKGLGSNPYMPRDPITGKVIIEKGMEAYSFLFTNMEDSYNLLRNAPGTAATAELQEPGSDSVQLFVTVVTANEAKDFFAEAKRQLLEVERMGFEALAKENKDWYDDLYERREHGRIMVSSSGQEKERIDRMFLDDTFRSWGIQDGGYCSPDPRIYEGCETYANYDVDMQAWHSLPCYNEVFPVPHMVHNRHEPLLYYCWLIEKWHDALKQKAWDQYGLPGMIMGHGYLPPAKPHPWYIENQTFDMCLEVAGEVIKVLWDQWDYRADEEMLKSLIYPAIRDLAIFYEAFCRRNFDGRYYNIAPINETENFGITFQLKTATNTTAGLTVFRMILNLAAEAAEYLGTDKDLIPGWREVADNLAPYPTFKVASGDILGGNAGEIPRFTSGDHGYTADYVAILSDETNLDSPQEDKDLLARSLDSVRASWGRMGSLGYILVGKFKDHIPCGMNDPAGLIEGNEQLASHLVRTVERLLNSRSRRIHLFPVLPDWAEVAFRGFQARGGFLVSAAKDKDGVKAVLIKARRSIPCMVMNPWPGKIVIVTDTSSGVSVKYELNTDNGVCIVFDAAAGHEYSLDRA